MGELPSHQPRMGKRAKYLGSTPPDRLNPNTEDLLNLNQAVSENGRRDQEKILRQLDNIQPNWVVNFTDGNRGAVMKVNQEETGKSIAPDVDIYYLSGPKQGHREPIRLRLDKIFSIEESAKE